MRPSPRITQVTTDELLEAVSAALLAGRLATDGGLLAAARAARAAPPPPHSPRPPDLLLDGFALLITDGYAASAPLLKRAASAFLSQDLPAQDGLRWLWPHSKAMNPTPPN